MKRIGITTFAAMLAALVWTAPAQGQLSLGVAAGATSSYMSGSLITASDSDWGALMGGWGSYRLESNLAFQLEANWVQKGGRGTVEGVRDDFDLDYFELPLTAQLVLGLSPTWNWNLYAGIALAFQTACEVSEDDGTKADCEVAEPTWSFASTEWSVPFGTSFSYRFNRSALTADVRYSYGLTDAIENLRLRNRSWQFILRWGFGV